MDKIQRYLAYHGKINITCVETTELVEEARKVHDLSPVATAALGRVLTMGVLMASSFKAEEDCLTLQIKGNGPIGGITVTVDSKRRVRGYVTNPRSRCTIKKEWKIRCSRGSRKRRFFICDKRYWTKRTIYWNGKANFRRDSRRFCKLLLYI